jgi:hypothetical protein
MAMLDDILKQSQPGVNPQLEEMVAKMLSASGMAGPQAAQASGQQAPPSGGLGALPAPGPGGVGIPGMPGSGAQAPDESNETYKVLISKGVPPEIARQALGNPEILKQILAKLFQAQQGPAMLGPQEQPQMQPSGNNRQSSPPLGGGGGYG